MTRHVLAPPQRVVAALIGILGLALGAGCAGISPVQVGQTAGMIAGAAAAPGVGAPVGALVGLLAGILVQHEVDKVTERRERKELSQGLANEASSSEAAAPPSGEPVRVWVDETVKDGRLVAGHFETRSIP